MRILVTGSTGQLGSALLRQLKGSNDEVRITSRRKPEGMGDFTWVYSDMLTGEGLEAAVKDVDVIIHTATSPTKSSRDIEITGFENFLGKLHHIQHFIYPSIVGIEEIPFNYYRLKYEAESLLKSSNIPYTIVRATQFHGFVENLLISKPLFKRYIVPGKMKFQSVDVNEYASHLIDLIHQIPQGRTEDFCGPEILTLKEMANLKIKVNDEDNRVLSIPLAGKLYRSFTEGKNTNSMGKMGKIKFEQYLKNKLE
ncbi:nmra-like family protein [Ureibacillus sinduriensis BLB-1 = JCM 15800]|uniref:Nmra-like family protein n=1 Tax=Ureibacillus sinduriensis BLB-1 = JCM 15800 TaxID=1384057 RepID=A0A0A3INA6_9BACL|nr:nmra-like family protein [Ureibacillus sinduriensis BLB-1 = JCM 15800]